MKQHHRLVHGTGKNLGTGAGSRVRRSYGALVALVLTLILAISPASAEMYSVVVKDYHLSPPVLMPNERGVLTVTLQCSSTGTQTDTTTIGRDTSSTTLTITPYIDSVVLASRDVKVNDNGIRFEGQIGPGQEIPLTFVIDAPSQNGIYFPELLIRIRDGPSLKYPIPVNVNTQVSALRVPTITLSNTFPFMVKPGTREEGTLTITNAGSSRADNVRVTINGSSPAVSPAGINSFQIDTLLPGDTRNLSLTFLIDKKTDTGLVEVPVDIAYTLVDGSRMSQTGIIGLDVRGASDIGITSVETIPSRVKEGEPFNLIIRVQNTGTGDATSVGATIDLPVGGAKEAFVGKIKPGNDAPATFILQGADGGDYQYTAVITSVDDWGTHTLKKTLTFTVPKGEGIENLLVLGVIIVVIALFGYWYMKRRKGTE